MKVIIAGDYCSHSKKEEISKNFCKNLLKEVKPHLDKADIKIVNLECPLAEERYVKPIIKSGPNLIGLPENLALLTEGGFDCAILANNHFGDMGEEASVRTLELLDDNGIAHIGGGRNIEEAYRAWRVVKDGIKLSFVAVCENEFGIADEGKAGSAGFSMKRTYDKIREEKNASDFVVVIFHGGNEMNPVPSPGVCERYRLFTDFGADAVIAMHTHCIQGMEYYNGKPVVYSMGNFYFPKLFETGENGPWNYGYMSLLEIEKGKSIRVTPIPYKMIDEYRLIKVFEGEEKECMLNYIDMLSKIIENPDEVKSFYHAWCAGAGLNNVRRLHYDEAFENTDDTDMLKELAVAKNLHSCEAHNELIKTVLNIVHEGKLAKAAQGVPELKEISKMPV